MRIAARSPAEGRAVLSCVSAGLVAVTVGAVWHQARRDFWLGAMILSLDLVLVLAGSRAPRVGAMAALVTLAFLLGLAALCFLALSLVVLVHEVPLGAATLGLFPLAVMCVVQWLAFRAVAESDRLHE